MKENENRFLWIDSQMVGEFQINFLESKDVCTRRKKF